MRNSPEGIARRDLAAAHRLAVRDGLNEGTWNHMSLISPDNPEDMLISPGHTHWAQVTASNLALLGPDGALKAGAAAPIRAGWVIHHPVHVARPDMACIIHVHAPYVTSLSMREDIRFDTRSSQQAAQFHDDVAYFETYDGLLAEESEGARMAEALGDCRVLILRNHGVLVLGTSVAGAYIALYQLERAAMYQLLATAGGGALTRIPEEIAAAMGEKARAGHADPHFEAMRRLIDATEPDYVQ